jgi:hypothetical protein
MFFSAVMFFSSSYQAIIYSNGKRNRKLVWNSKTFGVLFKQFLLSTGLAMKNTTMAAIFPQHNTQISFFQSLKSKSYDSKIKSVERACHVALRR